MLLPGGPIAFNLTFPSFLDMVINRILLVIGERFFREYIPNRCRIGRSRCTLEPDVRQNISLMRKVNSFLDKQSSKPDNSGRSSACNGDRFYLLLIFSKFSHDRGKRS